MIEQMLQEEKKWPINDNLLDKLVNYLVTTTDYSEFGKTIDEQQRELKKIILLDENPMHFAITLYETIRIFGK